MDWYANEGYEKINPALRGGGNYTDQEIQAISSMDAITNNTTLTANVIAYRGMSGKHITNLAKGAILRDNAFLSMSLNAGVAHGFAGDTVVKIRIPKGTRVGIPIMTNKNTDTVRELELVGKRRSEIRIASVHIDKDGITQITADYLSPK